MPLLIGGITCPVSICLLHLTARAPKPSASDIAARTKRTAMTPAQRRTFLCEWGLGIGSLMLGYALLTGIRQL
eukprot:3647191-Prymnesium_polylepis.1